MRRIYSEARFAFAALALGTAIFGQAPDRDSWPADARSFQIHMVGQAHIDAVWLWPWPEGFSVVQSTFRSALERMRETPGFVFTASSAQFYEWVGENDPELLAEIRKRVQEGRWDAVGGWWVEPDVNLPSGEALIRQGLYGQLTYRKLLGRIATTGYNPDSFGHPGSLPQILSLLGLKNYVFQRPGPKEKSLPQSLFWWQSADGTKVLAYRIPASYNDDKSVRNRVLTIVRGSEGGVHELMDFYGAGDHGGGATKENIQSIQALQKQNGAPKVRYSGPDNYFAEVRRQDLTRLPVIKDDLQHHSVGCYTAESEMKKANRMAETALVAAEKLTAIGSIAWNADYPKSQFESAWKKVLFLQFHDSLAGTALPEHYETTARDGHGYALSVARTALYEAAEKLAWQIPAQDADSKYLVAFNLQPWPLTANLEYDLEWPTDSPGRIEDDSGRSVAHQWTRATTEVTERKRLIFRAEIPAFGYRQFRIEKGDDIPASDVGAEEDGMQNQHLRVRFASDGRIGIFDKDNNREVFAGGETGAAALVMKDESDTWSHDVRAYEDQIGAFGDAQVKVMENGPLRARVRVTRTYSQSSLTTDWLLYSGARTLEARVQLDWHEHQKMIKLSLPVDVKAPRATYEIPYGNIVRDTNGDENPGQRWIDVSGSGTNGTYGLAAINDAKYGYSVSGHDLRISIARGAAYANHQPQVLDPHLPHLWQDQGVQNFRMLFVPHRGDWRDAEAPKLTEGFMSASPLVYQGIHPGTRPLSGSMLSVNAENVVVGAIKRSESGNDLIFRLVETEGRKTATVLRLPFAHREWSGDLNPYEIKTLRMNPNTGEIKEVNALEE
ncbi:MAG: alpha-mannosidase [Acidobacteriaceae bacterium]|nr:alpha-mannosidase [Acidobacteriaceae bacterium]